MSLRVRARRGFLKTLACGAAACALNGRPVFGQTTPGERPMRTIVSEGFGRIVILGFDRGERLREGIRDKLKELGVKNAVLVSAIGTPTA